MLALMKKWCAFFIARKAAKLAKQKYLIYDFLIFTSWRLCVRHIFFGHVMNWYSEKMWPERCAV
jgi:hypothetical protein